MSFNQERSARTMIQHHCVEAEWNQHKILTDLLSLSLFAMLFWDSLQDLGNSEKCSKLQKAADSS